MTLLSALRATKVLGLAVALVAGGMTAADAGDGWGSSRHHGHHHRSKWLPSIELPGHGGRLETVFHSGGEARQGWQDNGMRLGVFPAYRLRADSITIYVGDTDAIDWRTRRETSRRSEPKVITVAPGQNDCSWEAGVCVIRPNW